MAKNGHFSRKRRKTRDSGDPGRGFYINPSRRGPAVPGEGFLGPAQEGRESRPPGEPSGTPPGPRTPRTAPGYRGAPARGVDVKPPSPGSPDPVRGPLRGPGTSRGLPLPRGGDPGSRIRDPQGPSGALVPGTLPDRVRGAPPEAPEASRARPRRGFYINPSRRGPAVPGGPGTPDATLRRRPGRPGLEGEVYVRAKSASGSFSCPAFLYGS